MKYDVWFIIFKELINICVEWFWVLIMFLCVFIFVMLYIGVNMLYVCLDFNMIDYYSNYYYVIYFFSCFYKYELYGYNYEMCFVKSVIFLMVNNLIEFEWVYYRN